MTDPRIELVTKPRLEGMLPARLGDAALKAAFAAPPALASSATIYVHSSGDDNRNGLTWATAKKTIPAAITALGSAGGTVEMGAGTFNVSSTGRFDTCTFTNGSATVTDPSIAAGDLGAHVINQYVGDLAVISSVTPGVSFTITDKSGVALPATGSGSGKTVITKPAIVVPPGVRLRGRGGQWTGTRSAQSAVLTDANTWVVDAGTGVTIMCDHPLNGGNNSGQRTSGIEMHDFAVQGNTGNLFGIAQINDWYVVVTGVDSIGHGVAGLITSGNANATRFSDCHFAGNGTATATVVTGGWIMLDNNPVIPFGPVATNNCFFTANRGWGVVGTADFVTPKGARSVRITQGQFNSVGTTTLTGSGTHVAISGNEHRSMLEDCIFESADFLDLDVYDNPVVAIACKFKATGGNNGTLPYTVRINANATLDAISCGFLDATSYHVLLASNSAALNWRSCFQNTSTVLAADASGNPVARASARQSAGSTMYPLEPLGGASGSAAPNETVPRLSVNSSTIAVANQRLQLTFFTANQSKVVSNVDVDTGTASGGPATYIGAGLYSVASTGTLTLIAQTNGANTGALSGANVGSTLPLAASAQVVAGERYAIGWLIDSPNSLPTFMGVSTLTRRLVTTPIIAAAVAAQTSLPASITSGSLSNTGAVPIWSRVF